MLNLDKEESVILEVRKHWFVFLGTAIGLFMAVFVPVIGYAGLLAGVPDAARIAIREFEALFVFAYSIYMLAVFAGFALTWTNFYLDVWYITGKRIIDIEQKSIFHREVSNLRFDKIQDISIEVKGVIATMLNFGDIRVQTAGEDSSDFVMKYCNNPERVRKIIFSQHNIESEKPREVKLTDEADSSSIESPFVG